MKKNIKSQGFTLVEIMIVVLIIGILLAIAVPNFVKARQNSRLQTVIGNLKQLESAKQQWAMDKGKVSTDTPVEADLVPTYMQRWPIGPVGAKTDYAAGTVGAASTFKSKTLDEFQAADPSAAITAAGL
jgi:prepilin-type N-terminal cleavage/methylation domain-containing protein